MRDWLIALLVSTCAALSPIQPMLIVVGLVIFADLFTGMWAAKKRGEKIKSAGLRRSVSKILVYQSAIVIGFLIETYLLSGIIPISKICAGLIGTTEGLSIFENLNSISGTNIFKGIIKKLGSVNDYNNEDQS